MRKSCGEILWTLYDALNHSLSKTGGLLLLLLFTTPLWGQADLTDELVLEERQAERLEGQRSLRDNYRRKLSADFFEHQWLRAHGVLESRNEVGQRSLGNEQRQVFFKDIIMETLGPEGMRLFEDEAYRREIMDDDLESRLLKEKIKVNLTRPTFPVLYREIVCTPTESYFVVDPERVRVENDLSYIQFTLHAPNFSFDPVYRIHLRPDPEQQQVHIIFDDLITQEIYLLDFEIHPPTNLKLLKINHQTLEEYVILFKSVAKGPGSRGH